MFIQEITWQNRNDFHAIMQCEHCDTTRKLTAGYDDLNYHQNVIPAMSCSACGEKREKVESLTTASLENKE